MKTSSVFVKGRRYPVREKPDGSLRAHLFNSRGWTSVWAEDYTALVRRIRQALENR